MLVNLFIRMVSILGESIRFLSQVLVQVLSMFSQDSA